MIAVDTNILTYAHRAEMDLHGAAARALIDLAEGRTDWGIPVFCATEFVRVATHRRIFNPPSTLALALDFLEALVASPACRIFYPGPGFLKLLAATALQADARGNLVFNAQIAALCREHGIGDILTNDRDFERFKHLRVRYL